MADKFRYYGVRPGDWYEGANDGMTYELCFLTAPDAATRTRIAMVFEKAVRDTAVETRTMNPWRWGDRWARFAVGVVFGEGGQNDDGEDIEDEYADFRNDDFYDGMKTALVAIHAVAPLEEAIFVNARHNSASEWEERTIAAKPVAGPAPKWSDNAIGVDTMYTKLSDRFAVEDFTDGEFDKARAAARKELGRELWFEKYKDI